VVRLPPTCNGKGASTSKQESPGEWGRQIVDWWSCFKGVTHGTAQREVNRRQCTVSKHPVGIRSGLQGRSKHGISGQLFGQQSRRCCLSSRLLLFVPSGVTVPNQSCIASFHKIVRVLNAAWVCNIQLKPAAKGNMDRAVAPFSALRAASTSYEPSRKLVIPPCRCNYAAEWAC
jgi:hypothetical protein